MYPGIHYIHHTYIYNTQDTYAMCLGEFVKKKSKKKNIKGLETCVSSPLGGRVKKKNYLRCVCMMRLVTIPIPAPPHPCLLHVRWCGADLGLKNKKLGAQDASWAPYLWWREGGARDSRCRCILSPLAPSCLLSLKTPVACTFVNNPSADVDKPLCTALSPLLQ